MWLSALVVGIIILIYRKDYKAIMKKKYPQRIIPRSAFTKGGSGKRKNNK